MKSCIRVPRVFLPRENTEKWAVPACDRHAGDRAFWENAAREIQDAPSVLGCVVPDEFLLEDEALRIKEARETQYDRLESGAAERLNRGMILVRRETSYGLRRGILANLDLEEYSPEAEKSACARASTETLKSLVSARRNLREASVLEFPHTVLLYRDKRDKILRSLGEDLELLYDFDLPDGKVSAYFIPDAEAQFLAHDLTARADPCFLVADGNHTLAAAKAHWEEVKKSLSPSETRNHPARFTLAEFVNAAEESVVFEPVHRVVSEVEPEAFCDFFEKNVKCKRQGNILYPILSGPESYCRADEVIAEFLHADFGKLSYRSGKPSSLCPGDGAVVAMPAVEKEELAAAAKSGKRYPPKCFTLGKEKDARYSIEGREISYD